jgi:hypothetical protein
MYDESLAAEQNTPNPPHSKRGASHHAMTRRSKSSSPFVKGDRGGFCVVLEKFQHSRKAATGIENQ